MQPLELIELPQNTDMVSVYIDGRRLSLNHSPFVSDHILYVPVVEMAGYWNYEITRLEDGISLCDGEINHRFTESYVYDVSKGERRRLDYLIISVDGVIFADAKYFIDEHDITVTWENGTYSAYFASVLHYDGYRIAPEEIFHAKKALDEYKDMFIYVDGAYYKRKDGNSKIVAKEGIIYLSGGDTSSLEIGSEYRFCFRYEGVQNSRGVPYGRIWEICGIDNERRIGNMLFAESSWKKIKAGNLYRPSNVKNSGIDKEALVTMLRRSPHILSDRKKLRSNLNDLFPENRRDVNLIMCAYDNHVFSDIDITDELDDIFVHRMVKKLVDNNGIQLQFAIDAVCLCCEVYGVRIKGKNFVSKAKYNAETEKMLIDREKRWVEPIFKGIQRMGDAKYPRPVNWGESPASVPYEGYYYYPYDDNDAMIWVSRKKLDGPEKAKGFNYQSFIIGMARDVGNIISITDFSIDDVAGKKANFYLPVGNRRFEQDAYFFPYGDYVYGVMFGEDVALTVRMQQFEKEFMSQYVIRGGADGGSTDNTAEANKDKASACNPVVVEVIE